MEWLLFGLLAIFSFVIAFQDFKTRLISVWLIIGFTVLNITYYLIHHSVYQFIENVIFCLCYFLFSYLILILVFYLKTKRFEKLLDSKIGWGDVFIFIAIGCCIEPIYMIYFFTTCFIISLLAHLLFLQNKKNIPMAGFLVLFYFIFRLILAF